MAKAPAHSCLLSPCRPRTVDGQSWPWPQLSITKWVEVVRSMEYVGAPLDTQHFIETGWDRYDQVWLGHIHLTGSNFSHATVGFVHARSRSSNSARLASKASRKTSRSLPLQPCGTLWDLVGRYISGRNPAVTCHHASIFSPRHPMVNDHAPVRQIAMSMNPKAILKARLKHLKPMEL